MELPNPNASFLCFLPELQNSHLYGIEGSGFQQSASRLVPGGWKRGRTGSLELPNGVDHPMVDTDSCPSNAFGVASAVHDHGEDGDTGRLGTHVGKSGAGNKLLDLAMISAQRIAGKEDSCSSLNRACNGNHDPAEGFCEEEDALAYNIVEFFNAFRDGQEHYLLKFTEMANSHTLEGSLRSGGIRPRVVSKRPSQDHQLLGIHGDECSSGGGPLTHSHCGSGSSYLEVNSLSPPLSGYLPFSGPITSFGHPTHVTYSGSVSHRSDSSTASTHSFAFPILPWEWNSSPVKLAQPDKRYTRQSWKQCLHKFFCCTK